MVFFVDHLTPDDLSDPSSPRGRLVEDLAERMSNVEDTPRDLIRQRIRRELKLERCIYRILLADRRIFEHTRLRPVSPPSPFDEHFDSEEVLETDPWKDAQPHKPQPFARTIHDYLATVHSP